MYKYMPQTCESENNYKERLYISHDISVYNATFFFSLSLSLSCLEGKIRESRDCEFPRITRLAALDLNGM